MKNREQNVLVELMPERNAAKRTGEEFGKRMMTYRETYGKKQEEQEEN